MSNPKTLNALKLRTFGPKLASLYGMYSPGMDGDMISALQLAGNQPALDAITAAVPSDFLFIKSPAKYMASLDNVQKLQVLPPQTKAACDFHHAKSLLSRRLPSGQLTKDRIHAYIEDIRVLTKFLTLVAKEGVNRGLLTLAKSMDDNKYAPQLRTMSVMALARIDAEFCQKVLSLFVDGLYVYLAVNVPFSRDDLAAELMENCQIEFRNDGVIKGSSDVFKVVSKSVDAVRQTYREALQKHNASPEVQNADPPLPVARIVVPLGSFTSVEPLTSLESIADLYFNESATSGTIGDSLATIGTSAPPPSMSGNSVKKALAKRDSVDNDDSEKKRTKKRRKKEKKAEKKNQLAAALAKAKAKKEWKKRNKEEAKTRLVLEQEQLATAAKNHLAEQDQLAAAAQEKTEEEERNKEEAKTRLVLEQEQLATAAKNHLAEQDQLAAAAQEKTEEEERNKEEAKTRLVLEQEQLATAAKNHLAEQDQLAAAAQEKTEEEERNKEEAKTRLVLEQEQLATAAKNHLAEQDQLAAGAAEAQAKIQEQTKKAQQMLGQQLAAHLSSNNNAASKKMKVAAVKKKKEKVTVTKKAPAGKATVPINHDGCHCHRKQLIDLHVMEAGDVQYYTKETSVLPLSKLLQHSRCKGVCQSYGKSLSTQVHYCLACVSESGGKPEGQPHQLSLSWYCSSCYSTKNKNAPTSSRRRVPSAKHKSLNH
ncbi:unnamed protein product [Cylindrotheca closterium]|uniref:Uncharacterized protein n=1 Tax=Cylindrotheca closterium TaxID=2856 RepID=A0AAD2FMZ0_9STRA|nr:unnamed protein product [Cylindrotheca closterium]CAJ1966002.1 unnamed protein product [Cylindrotheca closterium]